MVIEKEYKSHKFRFSCYDIEIYVNMDGKDIDVIFRDVTVPMKNQVDSYMANEVMSNHYVHVDTMYILSDAVREIVRDSLSKAGYSILISGAFYDNVQTHRVDVMGPLQ